jgi:hypothetical protein
MDFTIKEIKVILINYQLKLILLDLLKHLIQLINLQAIIIYLFNQMMEAQISNY